MTTKTLPQIMIMMPKGWESFLIVFSRLECTLKAFNEFRRPRDVADSRSVLPDWGAFGKFLGDEFFADVKSQRLAPTLIQQPPWHQEIVSGNVIWAKSDKVESVSKLFDAITTARNNLARGGKFNAPMSMIGLPPDFANNMDVRDAKLLREAKAVLLHALELPKCKDIRCRFYTFD